MASEGISSDVLKQQNFGLLLPKKSNLSFFGSGGGPARSEARRAGNLRGFAAPPSWRSAVGGGGCLLVSCTRLAPQHGALELLTAGAKVLRVPWHPRAGDSPYRRLQEPCHTPSFWLIIAGKCFSCRTLGFNLIGQGKFQGCSAPVQGAAVEQRSVAFGASARLVHGLDLLFWGSGELKLQEAERGAGRGGSTQPPAPMQSSGCP